MQGIVGDSVRWGPTEHLIASAIDAITLQTHALLQSRSKRRLRRPELMERPTDPKPIGAGSGMTPEDLSAKLARPRVDIKNKGGAVNGR